MSEALEEAPLDPQAKEIADFWTSAGAENWFKKSPEFDLEITERFSPMIAPAARGDFEAWRGDPVGALALILLLDQFPRNIHRDSADAFAHDSAALEIAEAAISAGHDARFENSLRRFFYIPFMHAEDIELQRRCIALCRSIGDDEGVDFGVIHAEKRVPSAAIASRCGVFT